MTSRTPELLSAVDLIIDACPERPVQKFWMPPICRQLHAVCEQVEPVICLRVQRWFCTLHCKWFGSIQKHRFFFWFGDACLCTPCVSSLLSRARLKTLWRFCFPLWNKRCYRWKIILAKHHCICFAPNVPVQKFSGCCWTARTHPCFLWGWQPRTISTSLRICFWDVSPVYQLISWWNLWDGSLLAWCVSSWSARKRLRRFYAI